VHGFAAHGVMGGAGLRVDLGVMMDAKAKSVRGLTGGIEHLLKKNKVEYVKGAASLTAVRGEVSVGERTLRGKHIILATGSEPTPIPPCPVDNAAGVIVDSTGALALKAVPKRMAVIGGGVIRRVDDLLADQDELTPHGEFVDGAAIGLGIDHGGGFGRQTRQILRHGNATQIMITQECFKRDGRRCFARLDQLHHHIKNAPMQFFRKMLRCQKIGDAIISVIVDEDRAKQSLFCFDIMRGRPIGGR
jgi:hypothetical protein